MPDYRRRKCKECGRHISECGPLSWTGLCAEDSSRLLAENIIGLHEMKGPAVLRWRKGMAASVGAVLLDERENAT